MKIFIVEDDPVIASAVAEHIASWGCETRIAQNFQNIVQEFVDFDPQLVLLDVGLPFYNGRPVCLFILNHCLLILNDIRPAEQQVALFRLVLCQLSCGDNRQPAVDILAGDVCLFAEKFDVKFCLILLLQ